MAEQPNTPVYDADEALSLLDQAWAYFTPGEPEPAPDSPYEAYPAAA